MDQIEKKTNFNIKQLTAIEILACDPGYKTRSLANKLKVEEKTIRKWKNNVVFIKAVYDRFMDIAGKHMPNVIMAQIREAELGNTQAATLVLKHFGLFQDSLIVKIESPFDQFLRNAPNKDQEVEEAEIVMEPEDLGKSFQIPEGALPPRDPSNDKPKAKVVKNNKKLKQAYKRSNYLSNRKERYMWLTRAKAVGISPLEKEAI